MRILIVLLGWGLIGLSAEGAREKSLLIQRQDIERDLQVNKIKLNKLQQELEQLVKALHQVDQSQSNWLFFGDQSQHTQSKRKRLRKVLSVSIENKLKILNKRKEQKKHLDSELKFLLLKDRYSNSKRSKSKGRFVCRQFPLDISEGDAIELDQSFGLKHDSETGVSWVSQGWWVNYTQGMEVRPCAPGKIVFNDQVEGRGRVVILEHQGGVISVYGNLTAKKSSSSEIDLAVKNDDVIGVAGDRFYFELRTQGKALNPSFVFEKKVLTEIGAR